MSTSLYLNSFNKEQVNSLIKEAVSPETPTSKYQYLEYSDEGSKDEIIVFEDDRVTELAYLGKTYGKLFDVFVEVVMGIKDSDVVYGKHMCDYILIPEDKKQMLLERTNQWLETELKETDYIEYWKERYESYKALVVKALNDFDFQNKYLTFQWV